MTLVKKLAKKNIGIFSTKQGHQSIAEAIREKIEREAPGQYEIKIFYTKMLMSFFYDSLYRIAPAALKSSYDLSIRIIEKDAELSKLIFKYFHDYTRKSTNRFIKDNQIDLAISAYFPFRPVLEEASLTKNIPHLNIITDPRNVHPWQIFPQSAKNLFFDQLNISTYQKKCRARVAGWFVGERYEADYDQKTVRSDLKIKDQLTFLIVSGSEGSTAVLKILPALINCRQPVQIFIACGKNQVFYDNVLGIRRSLKLFSQSKAKIIPLRFTTEIHRYMQAADLVIGKAGPNTLFESVATLTPFFAITHIAQEAGNLDIIKEWQVGYVEENGQAASKKLLEIIRHPEQLAKFQPGLKKLKAYNQKASQILMEEIKAALKNSQGLSPKQS